jgi:hypothetical protein
LCADWFQVRVAGFAVWRSAGEGTMGKALNVSVLVAVLMTGVPVPGLGLGAPALAAETAKPETTAKPPRRLSNSPDNIKKRECDAKWKTHKKEVKATGWKPYFTFMANCM